MEDSETALRSSRPSYGQWIRKTKNDMVMGAYLVG